MRVRPEHWSLLLTVCEKNPEIITNKFNGPEGKTRGNALWQNIVYELNSLGFGENPKKNGEGYDEALIDWKSKTKAKAAKIKIEMEKTGGGPANYNLLSEIEKRLLSLMGTKAIEGDSVQEMGFGQVTVIDNTNELVEGNNTNEVVEEKQTEENYRGDHDYINSLPSTSRKCGTPYKRKAIRRVLRSKQNDPNKLIDITEESLQVLKGIHGNVQNISDSLKIIASVIQQNFQTT